ncbi:MAG: WD40/YVTN/BNR-like repeat-containing protein, partial [Bacteroidota bacterium]
MKKLIAILMLVSITLGAKAQPWLEELGAIRKEKSSELTLHDFQKAFYQYWEDHDVKKGVFIEDGVRKKAPGWKQFKRWEWYWEMNADPATGKFPQTNSGVEYKKYRQSTTKETSLGNWTILGPNETTGGYAGLGRINAVAFHPNDKNTFWVGAPSGGIWETTDGGTSWSVLNDYNDVIGVSDIAVAHDYSTNPTLYIATGDRDGGSLWALGGGVSADNQSIGVLKSTDGGLNWQETGLSYLTEEKLLIGRLLLHPSNNDVLLAGTTTGIFKSTDGAATWEQVHSSAYVIDMEFNPANPDVVYASTMSYRNEPVIMRSDDLGETWATVHTMDVEEYR